MNAGTVFRKICILATILSLSLPLPAAMAKQHGRHRWRTKKPMVKVMTRNVYLGADIFKVVDAALNPDPALMGLDVPVAVAKVFATVQYTNFPARAEAIADEILYASPDVVGLQEMETYYLQSPGDMIIGGTIEANNVFIDFLAVLQEAMEARGLKYDAFVNTNADVELPMAVYADDGETIVGFNDVRMVDHDVILVRRKHEPMRFTADSYFNNLELSLSGVPVVFTRGYLMLDVKIKGTVYCFVNTHLEVRDKTESIFRVIQSDQMGELLGEIEKFTENDLRPVILLGDFNSSIEDVPGKQLPYTPPYKQAVDAGYLDTWLLQKNPGDGFTSGFEETINDPYDTLETRIDLIFLDPYNLEVDRVHAKVVGDDPNDMTPPDDLRPYGLWPSDHAGVVSKMTFERRGSHRHKKR